MLLFPIVALSILIVDQLSKFFILKSLHLGDSLPVIENIFHISLIFNRGTGFGLFAQNSSVMIWIFWISFLMIVFICVLLFKGIFFNDKPTQIFTSLILGGAFGNLIDRIRFGYVIDFLDVRFFTVFNIADIAITFGITSLIIQLLRHKTVVVRKS